MHHRLELGVPAIGPARSGLIGNQMVESHGRMPHALKVAHEKLIVELDKGIEQFDATLENAYADEVCAAIERFVDEFRRVPVWADELTTRSTLVLVRCEQGTAFRRRMDGAFNCYHAQPKKPLGPKRSGAKLAVERLKPKSDFRFETDLTEIIGDIERAIQEGVIRVRCQNEFRLWLDECRRIAHDAKRVEADGCVYLLSVYDAGYSSATNWDTAAKTILVGGMGGAHLEAIKAAVDSLIAWARENPPQEDALDAVERDLGGTKPDGPIANGFRYAGDNHDGLTAKPWLLVNHLWKQDGRTCDFEDLAEPVWQDREYGGITAGMVASLRKRANKFFLDEGIPFEVSTNARIVSLLALRDR